MIHDDTLAKLRELRNLHDAATDHHRARAAAYRTDMDYHEGEAARHARIAADLAGLIETGARPSGRDAAELTGPRPTGGRPGSTGGDAP